MSRCPSGQRLIEFMRMPAHFMCEAHFMMKSFHARSAFHFYGNPPHIDHFNLYCKRKSIYKKFFPTVKIGGDFSVNGFTILKNCVILKMLYNKF